MEDLAIENKICTQCQAFFEVTQHDRDFYDQISPTFAGKKFSIPHPTLCRDCRQQRRLAFRNERRLYTRKCNASGKDIMSLYSPDKRYKVYDQKIRRSDDRDPMKYGREFDFTKSFTEQFEALMLEVPHPSIISTGGENCEYACFTLDSHDCYMSSGITKSEKVMYSNFVRGSDNMTDCTMTNESSYCYECIDCFKAYTCFFSKTLTDCTGCYFCEDCSRCQYCIACDGLEDKIYYFKNEPLGKEAYQKIVKDMGKYTSFKKLLSEAEKTLPMHPKKYANILLSEEVTGDNIVASKQCTDCFDIKDCEECKHVFFTPHGRYSQDCTYTSPGGVEYCYDVCSTVGVNNAAWTFLYRDGARSYYLMYCQNCFDCFGCIGLRNKQYCIFNKQYSKEAYEKNISRIIHHMQETPTMSGQASERGEYFHPSLSPFRYNETIAQEYYPLQKVTGNSKQTELKSLNNSVNFGKFGYSRSDYEPPIPQIEKISKAQDLPDNIIDVTDDMLKIAILCEVTNKPFRVTPQELAFYRKHNLPLPRKHPDQRHLERMHARNPRKLFVRPCDNCGSEMQTSYAPERSEIVYCEICYEKHVYG